MSKFYGVDYYPEQETIETVREDALTMRELGFNVVRIGEFAWCKFEPEEGNFDFSFFDDVLNILDEYGIKAIMCTPTATPPIWMVEKYPEILYVDNQGVTRPFGGRRHYCYNSDVYRTFCKRLAEKFGQHYGNDDRVIGFHIDNELGQEATGRCHCPKCLEKWHLWLQKKYGTINNFNEKAGTTFWGMDYTSFEQIGMPLCTIEPGASYAINLFRDNPTVRFEFEHFSSDSITEFANIQTRSLKQFTKKPITTNSTGVWTNSVNYYDAYKEMDVAALDEYVSFRTTDMDATAFSYEFMRGIKDNDTFWVVETTTGGGPSVWGPGGGLQPFPGAIPQFVLYSFASNVDLFTFFQFKAFRYGAEQLEAAVMNIDGQPDRRFAEFQQGGVVIKEFNDVLLKTTLVNEVAILFDYDSLWSSKIKDYSLKYQNHLITIHKCLAKVGMRADVISCDTDLKCYKLVVVPSMLIMTPEKARKIREYVEKGGIVYMDVLSGIKNEFHNAERMTVPNYLDDVFGIRVAEGEAVFEESVSNISFALDDGKEVFTSKTSSWQEVLQPIEAKVIAKYTDTFRNGETIATENSFGAGIAIYGGSAFEDIAYESLFSSLRNRAGIEAPAIELRPCVQMIKRINMIENIEYIFLFNFEMKKQRCMFKGDNAVLIRTSQEKETVAKSLQHGDFIELEPKGYALIKKDIN